MPELGALPSRTPESRWRGSERVDIVHGGVWAPRTPTSWIDAKRARKQSANGLARVPAAFLISAEDAWRTVSHELHVKLAVLAVLDSVRTATTQQLAAMTGYDRLAFPHSKTLRLLFAMGLVDYGTMTGPFGAARSSPATQVWRPSSGGKAARARLERELLTWPEWVLATGGRPWVTNRQSSRHDVLTTELLLRACEYIPEVTGFVGEKFSDVRELMFESWGRRCPIAGAGGVADATLLRSDGLRIAVETTVSVQRDEQRTEAYARLLDASGAGTVVLFLVVSEPGDASGSKRKTKLHVSQAVRRYPGVASERIFVVDWRDWFPSEGEASEAFGSLRAERYDVRTGQWVTVDLARAAFPLPEGARQTPAVVSRLLQSPHWLRAKSQPLGLHDRRARTYWGGPVPYPDASPTGLAIDAAMPARLDA